MDKIRVSWTTLSNFMQCPKKFKLKREGWELKDPYEKRSRLLGSAVHSALASVLYYICKNPQSSSNNPKILQETVSFSLQEFRKEFMDQSKTYFNGETGQLPDQEYTDFWDDLLHTAREIALYQLEILDMQNNWVVPLVSDILTEEVANKYGLDYNAPFIEQKFVVDLDEEDGIPVPLQLSGIIDAVVFDKERRRYIMLDWKTRQSFIPEVEVAVDNQLLFYAMVLNGAIDLAGIVEPLVGVYMYQLKNYAPKKAVFTKLDGPKKGAPSMAAQATTWEKWAADVAAMGFDPYKYEEAMRPKLKTRDDFTHVDYVPLTPDAALHFYHYLTGWGTALHYTIAENNYPPAMNGFTCRFCEFKLACAGHKQHGEEVEREYLEQYYTKVLDTS